MDEKTKIARINEVVTDYFSKNPEEEEISAKDLMPEFVEAGIWKKSHASYLRNCYVYWIGEMSCIKFHLYFQNVKKTNTKWQFKPVEK